MSRQRNYRQRNANGHRVFRVTAPFIQLSAALIEGGFLEAWDCEDVAKVEDALNSMVQTCIMAAGCDDVDM
jgi:hypothetical protein